MNPRVLPSTLRVTVLLVKFRLRHARNSLLRGGGSGSRWMSLAALLLPVAYVGLFVSAFTVVAEQATFDVQAATLAVVAGGLTLASFASKLTGGDAITAGAAENEFFLSRPVSLAQLVTARALASALLDVWGALFLVPVLAAAAVVWNLGARGFIIAALSSWLVQMICVALGQGFSLTWLGRVPLARRRLLQTALGLLAAFAVAVLWVVASFILRQPERFVAAVAPWKDAINRSPLGMVVAPVVALRQHGQAASCARLAIIGLVAVCAVMLARVLGAQSAKRGWEDAGSPFAGMEGAAGGARTGAPLSVAGKELRLLLRDRGRLVSLMAMPVLFVGVQIFGAVGLDAFGGDVHRAGLLAYSLSAYMATLGPLPHMQGERRAFWVLRTVPVPLSRLMWGKARAWLVLIVAMGSVTFWGTVVLAMPGAYAAIATWQTFALVVAGCSLVCLLAIGVGCHVADLSHDNRNALGPGAIYLFLIVAGLFNVALVRQGEIVPRTLMLYGASVALVWATGMARAADALDPERVRRLTPADAMLATLLLFAGVHLVDLAPLGMSAAVMASVRAGWGAVVAAGASLFAYGVRVRETRTAAATRRWATTLARAALVAAMAAGAVAALTFVAGDAVRVPLVLVVAEEAIFRGLVQKALGRQADARVRVMRRWGIRLALPWAIASVASVQPWSVASCCVQLVSAIAYAATGRVWPAVLARMAAFAVIAR